MLRAAALPCILALAHGVPKIPEPHTLDDSLSLLQNRLTMMRSRHGPSDNPMGTMNSEGQVLKMPSWPKPDQPDFNITAEHRACVAAFKAAVASGNAAAINTTEVAMALLPVKLDVEEGVYSLLFDVLRNFSADEYQYVQQNAWRGLSDQASTELGAAAMSDIGGKDEGVRFLVRQLLAHPQRLYGYCADQCTVQYEALAVIGGLIFTDMTGSRTRAAMEEGLGEAAVHAIRSEYDNLLTVHTACRVMTFLLWHNASYAEDFKKAGALELINEAMVRFKDGDDTPFHFGFSVGQMYPVTQCGIPKASMEGRNAEVAFRTSAQVTSLKAWKPYMTFFTPS